jgi:hypothetical protein
MRGGVHQLGRDSLEPTNKHVDSGESGFEYSDGQPARATLDWIELHVKPE